MTPAASKSRKPRRASPRSSSKTIVSRTAAAKREGAAAAERSAPNKKARQRAVEYLFSANRPVVEAKMASIGLHPKSSADAHRRQQIEKALRDGTLPEQTLADWLNEIEGWGNHQVQFYQVTAAACGPWRNGKNAVATIDELDAWNWVDAPRPLWPGDGPSIYAITHSGSRLRVSWAEQRTYLDPCVEENIEDDDFLWKAYSKQHRRCFHHFDFDATLGHASLIMAKLPSGGSYPQLQDRLLLDLEPYVPRAALELVGLQSTLRKLEESPDVLRRSLNLQTRNQSKIDVTSANKKQDAFAGPLLSSIREELLDGTSPVKGMFYWLVGEQPLQRYVGSRVYPKQDRFSIEGQCTEREVMDVLRSMRAAG